MYKQFMSDARQRVTVLANFAEVWLAREGHAGLVGLDLLTKVQVPNLPRVGDWKDGAHSRRTLAATPTCPGALVAASSA